MVHDDKGVGLDAVEVVFDDEPAKHFSWLGEKLRKLNPDLIVLAR